MIELLLSQASKKSARELFELSRDVTGESELSLNSVEMALIKLVKGDKGGVDKSLEGRLMILQEGWEKQLP